MAYLLDLGNSPCTLHAIILLTSNTRLRIKQLPSPGCFTTFADHSLQLSPDPQMDDESGRRGGRLNSPRGRSVVLANIIRQWFVDRILYDNALTFWNSAPKFTN
eukprot:CAMPEP_0171624614 /NCGR_PEP_ID=MMETSP0990-20121206/18742_1 /TAXON_ID=483369 /ORGANISM="non described non described, Strain CCMP2098" /LENGTH=103 /DNA_ID=CAMNT_0012191233 /DNA_START=23 /DNA_END=331 /DNA_ORIENTATION=-